MQMRDFPAALRRRWYLTVTGILATAGLCAAAYLAFPPTYQAKSSIVLLPPATTVEEGGNPYLQLSDLRQAVDVTIAALSSQSATDQVKAAAPDGSYEVLPDYTTNGPIFIITADDSTQASTLATLDVVKDMVAPTLANLQNSLGIAPESQITPKVLTSDQEPTTVRKAQIRGLILALAAGLILSSFLLAVVDSALLRRAARREPATQADAIPDISRQVRSIAATRSTEAAGTQLRPRRLGPTSRATSKHENVVGDAESYPPRRAK